MKLRKEISQIKTDLKSLRSFAWIVGGIFLAIGILVSCKHDWSLNTFIFIGAILIAAGLIRAQWLKYVYIGWMTLGLVMGMIVAPVMFTLLFFLALTPVALIARLSRKKFLNLKFREEETQTYWITKLKRQDLRKNAENQF